jgi:hypothetical protein
MPKNLATPSDATRSRVRSIISTVLLIMISVMIVRDILARRWSSTTPPRSDVTQRSR